MEIVGVCWERLTLDAVAVGETDGERALALRGAVSILESLFLTLLDGCHSNLFLLIDEI